MRSVIATVSIPPVMILGGGIHGAALARELALNGVPVVLVEIHDIAVGATSKSSRLIHGGLRYLEYGDLGLVRESLIERGRLLKSAPHLVRPLRLFIPVSHRWSGLMRSALGFFQMARTPVGRWLLKPRRSSAPRGYWPVRCGLWVYDIFSWGDGLPRSRGVAVPSPEIARKRIAVEAAGKDPMRPPNLGGKRSEDSALPRVAASKYRWLCEYRDAQMLYPERCVFALLAEAAREARQRESLFRVIPHATFEWHQGSVTIGSKNLEVAPQESAENKEPSVRIDWTFQPSMIVNLSGAWGDLTLRTIDAATTPLFAGTKGSHFVTRNADLRRAIGSGGVYAETGDRRLAFILPFGDAVLVGTTDEPWSGAPEEAIASQEELDYLRGMVNGVLGLSLLPSDIESHYSGVRPLPRTAETTNAAVSREHSLVEQSLQGVPVLTLVGGKLTTFRAVSEQIADKVMRQIGIPRTVSTQDRMIIGAEDFPKTPSDGLSLRKIWAADFGTSIEEVNALWPLYGMRTKEILASVCHEAAVPVADSEFMQRTVRWMIKHEWVQTLDDLVERRLMLLFARTLTRATLQDLALCLVASGCLFQQDVEAEIAKTGERLQKYYGRHLTSSPATD